MILFYLLVSVMPLLKHPLWSEVVGDITVIKYLGVVCLIYALIYLPMRQGSAGFLSTPQARFFVAFSLLVSGLYLQAGNPELTIEVSPLMSFVSFLVFFFVTLTVVDTVDRLRWVLLTTVGSVGYASLHIIREWQKYGGMAAGYRPGYVTGDPNYFSVSALLCLPISIYLLRTKQPRWERNFCIATIVVTMLALTFAASRGGFVGLAAGAFVMTLHSKRRVRTLLIVMVLTLPLMMIAPSSPLTRILSPDQHDIYSADHRAELAKAGMRMFMAYPLTGIGPGNFKPLLDQFAALDEKHIAHNTYVQVMAEMGLPGIVLFCAVVIATFVSLHRVRMMMKDSPHQIFPRAAEALQTGLAAFLASAYFLTAEHHRLFWFIIFLSAVLHQLAVQVVAAETPPAPPRRHRRAAAEIGSPS